MSRMTRALATLALALSLSGLSAQESGGARGVPSGSSPGPFVAGRWAGVADLGEGPEEIAIRVIEARASDGGAIGLVDLPGRGLFGYPAEDFRRDAEGMSFSLSAAGPELGALSFRGAASRRAEGESFAVEGTVALEPGAAWGGGPSLGEAAPGAFLLALSPDPDRGESFPIELNEGFLAGSLVLPDSALGWNVPVVLLLSGAGEADRDGDNYNVPGRSRSLALLARELGARGIASLRYDKRGVGESLASAPASAAAEPSFDDYVDDAGRALRELAADPRFTRIAVAGHAEGALVGAAAIARSAIALSGAGLEGRLAGLAALCASGETAAESLARSLSESIGEGFPELSDAERLDLLREAAEICVALQLGVAPPEPGPLLAGFFTPEAMSYLASALRYDVRNEAAAMACPLLVAEGGADLQVSHPETELLLEARPDAAYRVIEGMSHALKDVGEDEEANYESFVDPRYPLGAGLADLVAAFARGDVLPGRDPRE
jgi:uncharacterized protein